MKLGEVRAGNLAQDQQGNVLMVVGFDVETKNVVYQVVDRSKYPLPDGWSAEPIPFDKTWLNRCGFPELNSTMDLLFNYDVCLTRFKNGLFILGHELHDEKEVKFVHEFQNIVRILTGEEATILLPE